MSLLNNLIGPATNLLDKFIEDKDQKAKLAHELATMADKMAHEQNLAQIAVNKEEAASGSLFKGGWRPAVGWVCALSFGYNFLIYPIAGAIYGAYGFYEWTEIAPVLDMGPMMTVLAGMLGIGGLRTYEKQKGLTV